MNYKGNVCTVFIIEISGSVGWGVGGVEMGKKYMWGVGGEWGV